MQDTLLPGRIIRLSECAELVGLSASTIRRLEIAGQFPRRVRLTESTIGWRLGEVLEWVSQRAQAPLPQDRGSANASASGVAGR